jgi:luciferase family oxidoreductase group 1
MQYGLLDFLWVEDGTSPTVRVADTRRLIMQAETLGFDRYWVGEHHLPGYASASPEVLIAAGLEHTRRIRLGAGALLLGYRDPLRVALDFRTLSALGNRVDLGIGRGRADRQSNHELLVGDRAGWSEGLLATEVYRAQAIQLAELLREHPKTVACLPEDAPNPQLWVCGSQNAAALAAELGAAFCYTLFHPGQKTPDVLQRYREAFRARHPNGSPRGAIAVAGSVTACAADVKPLRAAHRYLAYWPDIVGPAEEASSQLRALQAAHQPDELLWMDIEVSTTRRLDAMVRLAAILPA